MVSYEGCLLLAMCTLEKVDLIKWANCLTLCESDIRSAILYQHAASLPYLSQPLSPRQWAVDIRTSPLEGLASLSAFNSGGGIS